VLPSPPVVSNDYCDEEAGRPCFLKKKIYVCRKHFPSSVETIAVSFIEKRVGGEG